MPPQDRPPELARDHDGEILKLASSLFSSIIQIFPSLSYPRKPPEPPPPAKLNAYLQTISPFLQRLRKQLPSWLRFRPEPPPPPKTFWSQLQLFLDRRVSEVQDISTNSAIAAVLIALLSIILYMSWSNRFGGWGGRFSPFGRSSPNATCEVSESDFSYITDEDLARSRAQSQAAQSSKDPDVLVLKHGRVSYPLHFVANSIDSGELKIGDIRAAAARKLGLPAQDTSRIKILYRGRNLKDDARTARDEGFRSGTQSDLMCVVGEALPQPESSESEGEEDEADGSAAADGNPTKKKKPRKRKNKGKKKANSGTATPTGSERPSTLNPDATYVPHAAPPPRPSSSPPQPKTHISQTPLQKLEALASTFHTKFVPDCVKFMASPPADAAKRDYEHKRLTETIMSQILLKADAIEPEGDPTVRQSRKDLVKEAQGMLNKLDEVVK